LNASYESSITPCPWAHLWISKISVFIERKDKRVEHRKGKTRSAAIEKAY